jgi:hypothetical protein
MCFGLALDVGTEWCFTDKRRHAEAACGQPSLVVAIFVPPGGCHNDSPFSQVALWICYTLKMNRHHVLHGKAARQDVVPSVVPCVP